MKRFSVGNEDALGKSALFSAAHTSCAEETAVGLSRIAVQPFVDSVFANPRRDSFLLQSSGNLVRGTKAFELADDVLFEIGVSIDLHTGILAVRTLFLGMIARSISFIPSNPCRISAEFA